MQGFVKFLTFLITPIIGWLISALLAVLITLPLHHLWGWLGPIYFGFVPEVYLNMGFWDMAGMLILIGLIKLIVYPSAFHRTFTATKEKSQ